MATTIFRRDHLLRRILNPGTTATDFSGRLTTATLDHLGRPLVAIDFPATTVVATGSFIDIPATRIVYLVTVGGTTAAAAPTAPGVGNTVASGSATLRQLTSAGT